MRAFSEPPSNVCCFDRIPDLIVSISAQPLRSWSKALSVEHYRSSIQILQESTAIGRGSHALGVGASAGTTGRENGDDGDGDAVEAWLQRESKNLQSTLLLPMLLHLFLLMLMLMHWMPKRWCQWLSEYPALLREGGGW